MSSSPISADAAIASKRIESAPSMPTPVPQQEDDDHAVVERADILRIALVLLAVIASALHAWRYFASFDAIALAATLVGGWPIFHEAAEAVLERRMTMELSMTIALAAALAIGEYFTSLVIVLFVLVAEVIEGMTVARGRGAIRSLLDFLPRVAERRNADGRMQEIHVDQLAVGDVVLVRPAARIPVDGLVLSGHSTVDEASITGEPLPIEKLEGSHVYAGSLNQSGALEVRVAAVGRDTAFGHIIEAVERAESARAPIQKTADRFAGWLVYFALCGATLTYLITRDARSTISVIIVAGACGIAAGTPLAILGAIGRAARHGAIVKGGLFLELLAEVDTLVFDKTGTLTVGTPRVVSVVPQSDVSPESLLTTAASPSHRSEHPLSAAILRHCTENRISAAEPQAFLYTPGRGVTAFDGREEIVVGSRAFLLEKGYALPPASSPGEHPPQQDGASEILVGRAGRLMGLLRLADVLRPEARQAIQRLHADGLRVVLMSGDTLSSSRHVAGQLGLDEVHAELLPEQKLREVEAMLAAGRKVAMVGDGINDAPALTVATVGIAMGSGTDVARECADVVLIGNDLSKLAETIHLSRWCRRVIRQNFVGTLVVDGVGILLAGFGLLDPLLAAFIHVSSELVFIFNSTRLLPR